VYLLIIVFFNYQTTLNSAEYSVMEALRAINIKKPENSYRVNKDALFNEFL